MLTVTDTDNAVIDEVPMRRCGFVMMRAIELPDGGPCATTVAAVVERYTILIPGPNIGKDGDDEATTFTITAYDVGANQPDHHRSYHRH